MILRRKLAGKLLLLPSIEEARSLRMLCAVLFCIIAEYVVAVFLKFLSWGLGFLASFMQGMAHSNSHVCPRRLLLATRLPCDTWAWHQLGASPLPPVTTYPDRLGRFEVSYMQMC